MKSTLHDGPDSPQNWERFAECRRRETARGASRHKVLHIITQLAVGGATENTLTTCLHSDRTQFESAILCGRTEPDEEDLFQQAQENNLSVHTLPSLRRNMNPIWDLRAYRDMIVWLAQKPWDIVHTHTSKAGILGRFAAARLHVPVIIHTAHAWGHNDYMHPLKRRLFIALERKAARVSNRLIGVSQATCDRGLADGIGRREQYAVVHSGIDIAAFRDVQVDRLSLRRSLNIPEHAPVIGSIGRLAPQKAPTDFIEVAKRVHQRCSDAHFVFVGGGPMQARFEADLRTAGLQNVVHDLGYRNDVPSLLRVFDVFLLTSLWEGLPRVLPQAMCAGLPIVATNVDGTPEAVSDGETGFLLPPHDCKGMAERVLLLLSDEERRRRMGQCGLERVYPAFCDRQMVREIETIYRECLASASGEPGSSNA